MEVVRKKKCICECLSSWCILCLVWIFRQNSDKSWQENAYVHVQSKYQESCLYFTALKLAQQTATLTSTLVAPGWKASKHERQNCNTMSAAHRGAKGRHTGVGTRLAPSQQAGVRVHIKHCSQLAESWVR